MNDITSQVLDRIAVSPPYFALQNLTLAGEGLVQCVVPHHPTTGFEAGPIVAAEASRHLAILGSCAAAMAREGDDRHHYLATKAHFATLTGAPGTVAEPLRGEAVASWVGKRNARAIAKLTTESGRGVLMLDVEYTVMTPRMFDRLNPPVIIDPASFACIGTRPEPAPTPDGARIDFGPIPPEMCAGHFDGYPAAPVAIVMGELARVSGAAMRSHTEDPTVGYRVDEAHVITSQLARAGQHMELEARYLRPVNGGHVVYGTATADGAVFGEMTITLTEAHANADVVAA